MIEVHQFQNSQINTNIWVAYVTNRTSLESIANIINHYNACVCIQYHRFTLLKGRSALIRLHLSHTTWYSILQISDKTTESLLLLLSNLADAGPAWSHGSISLIGALSAAHGNCCRPVEPPVNLVINPCTDSWTRLWPTPTLAVKKKQILSKCAL